jgi:TolB-like protein
MNDAKKTVFLSYASEDVGAALQISGALRSAGIEVWFDQSELRGGDAWDAAIRRQIKACTLFIPLISRHTRARHEAYFRLEWKLAVDRSHLMSPNRAFLLPVVIDDTPQGDDSVPERFREVHWTRLPDGIVSRDFIAEVARILSTETSAPSPVAPAPASAKAAVPLLARPGALWWVAGLLVLVSGYALLNRFVLPRRIAAELAASGVPLPATPESIPQKSIAVLPFVDMSEKRDQEYFSDGLTEQLIEQLSKIRDLRVPARTSSFYFKGRPEDIATMAHKLRVANILEGSVRKSGERLRVTAELIRADSGYHVWSETYDREVKDVFDVQDEIAGAVVTALRLRLDPQQTLAVGRTPNTVAYNEYLLARQFYNQGNVEGFRHSVEAYRKAIALDPLYAAAYAGVAVAEFHLADLDGDAAARGRAGAAAERAVQLAPEEAEYYGARGFLRLNIDWDWAGASADFERALALDPNDSSVQRRYAELLGSLARVPEAVRAAERATELDPLSSFAWLQLGKFKAGSGDYQGARQAVERALEINPGWMYGLRELGTLQLLQGNAAAALLTFGSITDNEGFRLQGAALAQHSLGGKAASEQALRSLLSTQAAGEEFQIAEVYAWRGDKDQAFAWLERAYQQRDAGLSGVRIDPLLKSLHDDDRFAALLRQMKFPQANP